MSNPHIKIAVLNMIQKILDEPDDPIGPEKIYYTLGGFVDSPVIGLNFKKETVKGIVDYLIAKCGSDSPYTLKALEIMSDLEKDFN
jgi:hypothetical protein